MRALIRRAAEHPVSVLMGAAAVLVLGAVAFFGLQRELLPSLSVPVARVVCEYPGIPAAEMEQLVTVPLENALSSVRGVRESNSLSKEEISAVSLRFDWRADMRTATVDIRQRIDALYPLLPHGAEKPVVFLEDANDQPVLTLAVVVSPTVPPAEASLLVRSEIVTALRQTPGVAAVQLVGLTEQEVRVEVDTEQLAVAGLTLQGVAAGVAGSLCDEPLGAVSEGGRERLLKASSGVRSLEALRALPLAAGPTRSALRLGDLATVRTAFRQQTSFFHLDGRRCIGLLVYKSPDSGSLNTARQVRRRLEVLQGKLGAGGRITVVTDSSGEIRTATRELLLAMALGILATVVVLRLLLGRLLAALVVAAAVPVSLISVFLAMRLAGISLNVISLAGMAAGVGMIVDGGIVVLDSLRQHRARSPAEVAEATAAVAGPLGSSTATTVLVFLPILFIPGVTGALFRELVLTISLLLAASLLAALLLTPALFVLCGPQAATGPAGRPARPLRRLLLLSGRRPALPLLLAAGLLAGGSLSLIGMRWELLPPVERRRLQGLVRFPEGTPVSQADAGSRDITRLLRELPGVSLVHAAGGYDEGSLADRSLADSGPLAVRFEVQTAGRDASDAAEVAAAARKALDALPGIRHELRLPEDSLSRLLGSDAASGVRIEAQERGQLLRWAESLVGEMQKLGAKEIELDTRPEGRQTLLRLDATRLRHHGLQAAQVLETLRLALRGQTVGTVRLGDSRLEVRVCARMQAGAEEQLASLAVPTSGGSVAVGLLGFPERQAVFPELHRHDRRPCATVRAEGFTDWRALLALAPSASATDRQGLRLSPLDRSALREARREIILVFAFALLLIYLLLAAQFESLLAPLPILMCLPVSIGGSLLLLRLCRLSLNLSSFLGILILTGTAVNGPILIGSAAAAGGRRAVVAAAVRRLLPVAATTLTTMAALLPVAFTTRGGSALQSHMAVALIGGLAASLPAALLLFPALHRRTRAKGRT